VVEKRIYGRKWKLCQVKHNGTYSTQYLHVKILVRQGQRVNQGDVIGRVGSTGLATVHMCVIVWKNGVQVDALRLNLPTGEQCKK
jgi:murein DD-endopeptidase MepM/ murein hydrolase activator NlpD